MEVVNGLVGVRIKEKAGREKCDIPTFSQLRLHEG